MGLLHYLDTYKVCVIYSGLQALRGFLYRYFRDLLHLNRFAQSDIEPSLRNEVLCSKVISGLRSRISDGSCTVSGHVASWQGSRTQSLKIPLIKEYALNHIRDPLMI